MSNLKEIRTRIASVKTTRQVTSAMKMVSAAKLKKAQDAIIRIRPYAARLNEIMANLSGGLEQGDRSPYTEQRAPERILIVLVSSNRGLCGGFNSSVSKKAVELVQNRYERQLLDGNVSFLAVGRQGERFLRTRKMNIIEQLLPVSMPAAEKKQRLTNFIFEPTEQEIVERLIPASLKIQFYKALLESHAAEQGARMTAMHQATDNATELIRELTITFNKARQAAITNEILEVTNGAEALR